VKLKKDWESEISELSLSDITIIPRETRRRVTIFLVKKGNRFSAAYFLHPRGSNRGVARPKNCILTVTGEIRESRELSKIKLRVKEEAKRRGIDYVCNLLGS
jgi:hypothetical protein